MLNYTQRAVLFVTARMGLALEAGLVMHHVHSLHSGSANVKYVSVLDSTTIQLIALYSVLAYFWPEVCRGQHYNQCVVVC